MPAEPKVFCKIEVRFGSNGSRGVIAAERILRGSTLFRDGGVVVSSIEDVFPDLKYAVLIDDGIWLAPKDYDNMDATCFINHSCNSNVARIGGITYVAKRDIEIGDELTIDYATLTTDFEGWTLECECGQANCRKVITSKDYLDPHLAESLWIEWLPYVQRKILAARK